MNAIKVEFNKELAENNVQEYHFIFKDFQIAQLQNEDSTRQFCNAFRSLDATGLFLILHKNVKFEDIDQPVMLKHAPEHGTHKHLCFSDESSVEPFTSNVSDVPLSRNSALRNNGVEYGSILDKQLYNGCYLSSVTLLSEKVKRKRKNERITWKTASITTRRSILYNIVIHSIDSRAIL